ncbi:DUF998 domain-containing protein [Spirosoma sp. KUDC1026]|uniref:DUF998 domain-containing protein n=1 Tax=Spirosoma sp. KUDC1026 TaxID=2745947 RepID=UPI00159BEDC3|nr:DUF998 domain-containing protein [Spirosoma sp. KUDC1026]QKZ13576.1 DUF998 domain-containing protein [Spirosoma sp. KUDC1026]
MPFFFILVSTLWLVVGMLYANSRKPGYSHWRDTISELGEIGTPLTRPVSYGLFLPVGLLLWLAAWLTEDKTTTGLATCVGAGYVIAALFPCDVGSPASGSGRQQLHNLGGGIEYLGGAYWLSQLSPGPTIAGYSLFSLAAGVVVTGAVLLSVPGIPIRGLTQRIVEALLFGSLLLLGLVNQQPLSGLSDYLFF